MTRTFTWNLGNSKVLEKLARAACIADGENPDHFASGDAPRGPYLDGERPWYAQDGEQRPWHGYIKLARQYLLFQAMARAEEEQKS